MSERASGWYDDPHDDTLLRYWDGILWSDRTMPKLMPGLDHVGQARPTSSAPVDLSKHADAPGANGPGATRVGEPGAPSRREAGWSRQQPQQPGMYYGPTYGGHDPRQQAFGNMIGTPSGVLRRIVAAFLDKLIVGIPVALAMLPFLDSWVSSVRDFYERASAAASSGDQMPSIPSDVTTTPTALAIAMIVVSLVYETVLTARFGATFGKRALGIRVAPQASEPLDETTLPWMRSALRAVIKGLPDALGLVGALAAFGGFLQIAIILWALTNPLRQGLDDLVARSVVRRTR